MALQVGLKTVTLIINTSTFFSSLIHVARFLQKNHYRPLFFFDTDYPTIKQDCKICETEGFDYELNYCLKEDNRLVQTAVKRTFFKKGTDYIAFRITSKFRRTGLKKLNDELVSYRLTEQSFKELYDKYSPKLIILVGDLVQYKNALYIRIMHRQNKKTLILPSFMASYKEPCEHYFNNPQHNPSGATLFFLKTFFGKWVKYFRNKNLIRLPLKEILAKEILSLAPKDPWTIHSGNADIIAVEGEAVKQYGIRVGLPPNKFVVTGSISHDILFNGIKKIKQDREGFLSTFNIPPCKPILLSAIPPDMFPERHEFTEFNNYPDFLKFWVMAVCNQNTFTVVLNLHPSMKTSEFRYLEEFGCKVINTSILHVMPCCDLFVASISSTIQWSIALGIPTLNYDVYKYYYDDYDNVDGVVYVNNKLEFIKMLENFNDPGYLEHIRQKQSKHSKSWGIIDGRAGERILELVNNL